jgi:ornithine cyclodeaminase/alanine dehydrogenase
MSLPDILYLSDADVVACGVTADEVTVAVETAFRAKARGRASTSRRLAMQVDTRANFAAKGGVLLDEGFAAAKWYGYVGGNSARGLPDFSPLIILSAIETGLPVAIMDGRWISAIRTASITAATASVLARPDSRSIGFVACGTQAEANLDTLRARFNFRRVVAYSRRVETAERFAAKARDRGLQAEVVTDPIGAVEGLDIVVTSVPRLSEPTRFLDARIVSEGTFVAMVDMGFGWNPDHMAAFETVVTDDFEVGTRTTNENLNYRGEFAGELCELLTAPSKWAHDGSGRRALVFAGSGISDVAAAVAVYRRALEAGLGRRLPL